jgi:hypothetical protein
MSVTQVLTGIDVLERDNFAARWNEDRLDHKTTPGVIVKDAQLLCSNITE